jgi:hypothetical protein
VDDTSNNSIDFGIQNSYLFDFRHQIQITNKVRNSKYMDDSMVKDERVSELVGTKLLLRDLSIVKEEKLKQINHKKRKNKMQLLDELRSANFIVKEKSSP